jgi:hypothetical protein
MWNDDFEPQHHDPIQHDHDPKVDTLNDFFPDSKEMKGVTILKKKRYLYLTL